MKIQILILITLYLNSKSSDIKRVCLSPEGNEVDWYAIFLYPEKSTSYNKLLYGYFDEYSNELINREYEKETFPPNLLTKLTLDQKNNNFNYFFWNDYNTCIDDMKKMGCSDSKAHAKGTLIYDEKGGAFLLHSLPRFPSRYNNGTITTELPSNSGLNAQSFLCISISKNSAEKIAKILNFINICNNKSVLRDRVNKKGNEWIMKLISNAYTK